LKIVRLHGHLRKHFDAEYRIDARTPRECIYGLSVVVPGLRAYLLEHSAPGFRLFVGGSARPRDHLDLPSSDKEIVRLVPVVQGAGSSLKNVLTIVAGAALVFLSYGGYAAAGAAALGASVSTASALGSAVGAVGWGLALGGISVVALSDPKANARSRDRTARI
jgi:predicted phage tail protein